uniref:Uncharacterized protein n=1 Tax=Myoviridae sp. ctJ2i1 TaxID=2825079 RepID=A0A8S5V1U0_9CAUD|nr:MAG TPA: hypothetical protein [Myoviridae sp. ctJ2i1]
MSPPIRWKYAALAARTASASTKASRSNNVNTIVPAIPLF